MLSTLRKLTYLNSTIKSDDNTAGVWARKLIKSRHPDAELFNKLYTVYRSEKEQHPFSNWAEDAQHNFHKAVNFLFTEYGVRFRKDRLWKIFPRLVLWALSKIKVEFRTREVDVPDYMKKLFLNEQYGKNSLEAKNWDNYVAFDYRIEYFIKEQTWYDLSTNDGWCI